MGAGEGGGGAVHLKYMLFCSLQQAEGISGLQVLVKEGEEMFT